MIIVDTREQKPLWNVKSPGILKIKLSEGDYTTTELIGRAHAERKSGQDLYGSVVQGHTRFRKELLRALDKDITLAIFVECSREDFILKKFKQGYKRKLDSSYLNKIVTTISDKYMVDFIWCNGRKDMKEKMIEWFERQNEVLVGSHGSGYVSGQE